MRIRYRQVSADGVVRITLPRPVAPGPGTLMFEYDQAFDDRLDGLYRVREGDDWYVFSQLAPIAARRVFPCFDEPRFKTPFDIEVTAPEPLRSGVQHARAVHTCVEGAT